MKKFLSALLIGLGLWTNAPARTLTTYPTPSLMGMFALGADTTKTDSLSLETANAIARPGDLIVMTPGAFSSTPLPTNNNGSPGGGYITYLGSLTKRSLTSVPGISLTRTNTPLQYVSIKGITATALTGGYFDLPALKDSIAYDSIGTTGIDISYADSCTFTWLNGTNLASILIGFPRCNSTWPCALSAITNTEFSNSTLRLKPPLAFSANYISFRNLSFCNILRNQIRVEASESTVEPRYRFQYWYRVEDSKFTDNKFTFIGASYDTVSQALRLRDGSRRNVSLRDTTITKLGSFVYLLSTDGNGTSGAYNMDNKWDTCFFLDSCDVYPELPGGSGAIEWGGGLLSDGSGTAGFRCDTIVNCTILALNRPCIRFSNILPGTSLIDHNTFYGTARAGKSESTINFMPEGNWQGNLIFTNNIVYSSGTTAVQNETSVCWQYPQGMCGITSDYNLYTMYILPQKSRNLRWRLNWNWINTAYDNVNWPASGAKDPDCVGNDVHSQSGSPRFLPDSAVSLAFTGRIDSTANIAGISGVDSTHTRSLAYLNGFGGTNIGAYQANVSDAIRPGPIELATFNSSTRRYITWSAVGDDSLTGKATSYIVKWSTAAITDENWNAATVLSVPGLVPLPAESYQSFSLLRAWLFKTVADATPIYITVRAVDDVGNLCATPTNVMFANTSPTAEEVPGHIIVPD